MTARKRKHSESFAQYRRNLKAEAKTEKKRPRKYLWFSVDGMAKAMDRRSKNGETVERYYTRWSLSHD